MPQNKNLSKAWQQMLGDNWMEDRDRWLHTLGNLTLTGHNSELGDRPFDKKKEKLEEYNTKVVRLNSAIVFILLLIRFSSGKKCSHHLMLRRGLPYCISFNSR